MTIDMDLIQGIAVGIEFVESIPDHDIPHSLIIDIFFIRLLIQW